MSRKIFSASLVTGIVFIGAAFADEIDEQQREEHPLFCQAEESDEEASLELLMQKEEDREESLASCAGGKCPREMIERLRAQKRLERGEEEEQQEQLALNDSEEEEQEEQLV